MADRLRQGASRARPARRRGPGAALLACLLVLPLTACKEDIVFNVTQSEAIEIVVILGERDIDATTVPEASDKEPLFKIQVDAADSLQAKRILLQEQLPRVKPRGLNEIFQNPSMIPTATEERARLLIGLQGDLAGTLETVDNVVDAQVHVVMPEADPLESASDRTEASASVLIKYRPIELGDDEEERRRNRLREKEKLLFELRDDLLKAQAIWNEELVELVKSDVEQLKEIELYLLKHVEDKNATAANKALLKMKSNRLERERDLSTLQNLPKIKDLDDVLTEIDRDEGKLLPLKAASARALIASAIPRLMENSVRVEFTEVVDRTEDPLRPIDLGKNKVPKQLLFIVGGIAGGLALVCAGLLVWISSLQKKLKAAEAPAPDVTG